MENEQSEDDKTDEEEKSAEDSNNRSGYGKDGLSPSEDEGVGLIDPDHEQFIYSNFFFYFFIKFKRRKKKKLCGWR